MGQKEKLLYAIAIKRSRIIPCIRVATSAPTKHSIPSAPRGARAELQRRPPRPHTTTTKPDTRRTTRRELQYLQFCPRGSPQPHAHHHQCAAPVAAVPGRPLANPSASAFAAVPSRSPSPRTPPVPSSLSRSHSSPCSHAHVHVHVHPCPWPRPSMSMSVTTAVHTVGNPESQTA